jgi:hypothetical protein
MSRILIIHTPLQLEEASSLVDLLEASLPLPEGGLVCSSLPGYAWSQRVTAGADPSQYLARLDALAAVIALVDEAALYDAQLWFEVASAWARGRRVLLLLDGAERRQQLPPQLADAPAFARPDRGALITFIEDLAFDVGVPPRIGKEAQQALDLFSTVPAPLANDDRPTVQPRAPVAVVDGRDVREDVPPPPRVPQEALAAPSVFEPIADLDSGDDEPLELDDQDLEPVQFASVPAPAPRHSRVERTARCEIALSAGLAIGECSFHRDEGADFTAELDVPFGRFVDAVGGEWSDLRRLHDVELWLGAIDNLLQALPAEARDLAEWYEIGFQFSTLRSIAEQSPPADADARAAYAEIWAQSMAQLRTSAVQLRIAPREIRKLHAQLENLVGDEANRDYGNVGRALATLRELAASVDAGAELATAVG